MPCQLSADAVCRLIDSLLPGGYPVIEEVAALLGFSPRTFQRQLQEEGLNYSELVEHCRCRAACASLEHTREPIREIAANLGYRDPSSFSRAFRRWTGATPRTWRKQWTGSQGRCQDAKSGL